MAVMPGMSPSIFLSGVSIIYCIYALTTTDAATFFSGCLAVFIGWMIYMVRFNLLKQPLPLQNK